MIVDTNDIIPLYLDGGLNAAENYVSDGYVLVGMQDKPDNRGINNQVSTRHIRIDGEVLLVKQMYNEYYVLQYASFGKITRFQAVASQKIGGALTKNLTAWIKQGRNSSYDDMYAMNRDKMRKYKNITYEYNLKNKINLKITQFHHLHVRLRNVFNGGKSVKLEGSEAILAEYLDRYSDVEATHVTFWVYFYSLQQAEKYLFISLVINYGHINLKWLKKEGVAAKQVQHATAYDLSKLFELHVLENRVETAIDWDVEKDNRMNPNTVNLSYDDVYNIAAAMFGDGRAEGRKPMRSEWSDYWAQRAIQMPAGAIHSRYLDDVEIIKRLPRAAKNKKGFSSMLEDVDQDHFLSRPPELTAHVSTKYEWGKTRALYGCDYTSHVNADFGLLQCEDTFPSYIVTGSHATPGDVRKEMNSMNGIPFCYDFDDFNSQHLKDAMKAVIDAWCYTYSDLITAEQYNAAIWTKNSIDRMFVVNNYTEDEYESNGTLFSGWRLTSFVNTALNYVYLNAAGSETLLCKTIHNGDDVFGSAPNLMNAIKLIENAEAINARAQTSKMNIGTIAEFLRMDVKASDPSMAQYLTRACATFVHSRVESDAPYSLKNMVSAYYTRYHELISRGACPKEIRKYYRKQLYFARTLFNADKDVIDKLTVTDTFAGGVVTDGLIGNYRIEEFVVEIFNDDYKEIKTLTHNGVSSYITYLKSKFPTIKDSFKMSTVDNNVARMYNVAKRSCRIIDYSGEKLINERRMKGAWCKEKGIATVHKIRMGIADIVMAIRYVRPALANVLKQSGDPIKWMSILL